jgi:ZIP family zinc transporter
MPASFAESCAALAWGGLASVGLIVGAVAGSCFRLSHQSIAMTMSMGAGLLLAAASLQLAAEAIRAAGPVAALTSLLLGAAVVSAANALLARYGAGTRKRCGDCMPQPSEAQQPGSGAAIALGTAVDAVPEAMVLGLALHEPGVPVELLVAIAAGNLPEALSGAAGMRLAGRSLRYTLGLWGAIAAGATVATAAGHAAFGAVGPAVTPHLQAFGAGALLAMTAETMIPEAFHNGPRFSGFVVTLGFCVPLLLA